MHRFGILVAPRRADLTIRQVTNDVTTSAHPRRRSDSIQVVEATCCLERIEPLVKDEV